jgi:AraC-like DNA-binding protein
MDSQADTKDQWMVRAVVRYLQDNLVDTPSMEALAQRFGTYPKKLSAAFRAVLGKTIPEFLRAERLVEAERLLQHSSLSVTDIAAELGFSTAANFSTAFRQHAGMTPGVFRQRSRRDRGNG